MGKGFLEHLLTLWDMSDPLLPAQDFGDTCVYFFLDSASIFRVLDNYQSAVLCLPPSYHLLLCFVAQRMHYRLKQAPPPPLRTEGIGKHVKAQQVTMAAPYLKGVPKENHLPSQGLSGLTRTLFI